jgi:hypothetical protein
LWLKHLAEFLSSCVPKETFTLGHRLKKSFLVALAVALGCMMVYFILSCARDLQRTAFNSQSLYSKRVIGLSVQGDLQYATQESRRTFLYVLTTDDNQSQLEYVRRVRKADLSVSLLTGKSITLSMGPDEDRRLKDFSARWTAYEVVRDDIIALVLAGRREEAIKLELAAGAREFDQAEEVIRELKTSIEKGAAKEVAATAEVSHRAALELLWLLSLIGGSFAWLHYLNRQMRAEKASAESRSAKSRDRAVA